jgi:hypothetical protein
MFVSVRPDEKGLGVTDANGKFELQTRLGPASGASLKEGDDKVVVTKTGMIWTMILTKLAGFPE